MSPTPEQLNEMVNYLMSFANEMLTKAGEFFPFAAIVNSEGMVEACGAYNGEEHPQSAVVLELLAEALRAQVESGHAIAVGIAADVNIPPQFQSPLPDGVRIGLEAKGNSRLIYYPYKPAVKGIFKKSPPEFAEPFAVEVSPTFFAERAN